MIFFPTRLFIILLQVRKLRNKYVTWTAQDNPSLVVAFLPHDEMSASSWVSFWKKSQILISDWSCVCFTISWQLDFIVQIINQWLPMSLWPLKTNQMSTSYPSSQLYVCGLWPVQPKSSVFLFYLNIFQKLNKVKFSSNSQKKNWQ